MTEALSKLYLDFLPLIFTVYCHEKPLLTSIILTLTFNKAKKKIPGTITFIFSDKN